MNRTANERLKSTLDFARKYSASEKTTIWVLAPADARRAFWCTSKPESRDEIILEYECSVIATYKNGEEVAE
ncbi:MAG: hypothetical protein PHG73_05495 [Pygmaiobacter sp.]|nr:hypothetical protein [Pygmaiobacter sp.]